MDKKVNRRRKELVFCLFYGSIQLHSSMNKDDTGQPENLELLLRLACDRNVTFGKQNLRKCPPVSSSFLKS